MNLASVARSFVVTTIALVAGCAVAPTSTEGSSGQTEQGMMCLTCGDPPGDNGGGGGGRFSPPKCDSTSMCCYGGGDPLNDVTRAGACGQALIHAGCTTPNDKTGAFGNAVAMDSFTHWWFDVQCPNGLAAIPPDCAVSPFNAYFPSSDYSGKGAMCMAPPDAGYKHLLFDPNCGSGCFKAIY